jgi:hypothetical protein
MVESEEATKALGDSELGGADGDRFHVKHIKLSLVRSLALVVSVIPS